MDCWHLLGRGRVLLVVGGTLLFAVPMFLHPEGIASGDAFRDNDWLNCRSFDLLSARAILEDGQFPLRSHLVGGGFPILIHPSDGSWAPTLVAILLLGDVLGLKANLVLLFLIGALGVYGLARRWARLAPFPAAFAALLFALSGWMPSMLLVGFYHQVFYLPIPAILFLLLSSPGRPHRLGLAGFLLFVVLQQGGHAFPAGVHFLAFALWLGVALRGARTRGRWRSLGRLGAFVGAVVLLTAPLAFVSVGYPGWLAVLGPALALSTLAWRPMRGQLRRFAPWGLRLALVVAIAASLGAARVVGLAQLADGGSYGGGLEDLGLYSAGESPVDYWTERFYEGPRSLFSGLVGRVAAEPVYEQEVFGRPGSNLSPEYAYLGLTVPGLALALLGAGLALRRRRFGALVATGALYLGICLGWFLPPDLHFLLVRGFPWLDRMSQPLKYFNFFVLVAAVLLAGLAVQALLRRLPRGLARGVGASAAVLLLAVPLAQNAPMLAELFAEPRPAPPPAAEFHQVAMIGDATWLQLPAAEREQRLDDAFLRDFRRPDAAQEYHNVRRGVGTIDWYGTVTLGEAAIPRDYVTLDGQVVPNPSYRGEAWLREGGGEVRSLVVRSNTIDLEVELSRPDRVVVNQNHLPGFRVDRGRLAPEDGLLGVDLEPGTHQVRFTYAPRGLLAGLWVSAGAFLVWLAAMALSILRIRGGRCPL
jgi:hypothetical protein